VNWMRPKRPRLRLDRELYEQLRKQVLQRDRWQCQTCGSRQKLQVHHKQLRSQQGSDDDLNLIPCAPSAMKDCIGRGECLHNNVNSGLVYCTG
jgi:5-methylcytosine-specific restriction endonuclease McrA